MNASGTKGNVIRKKCKTLLSGLTSIATLEKYITQIATKPIIKIPAKAPLPKFIRVFPLISNPISEKRFLSILKKRAVIKNAAMIPIIPWVILSRLSGK